MSYQNRLFLALVILILTLTGCNGFNKGKISQDLLPGKVSGEVLFEDDFSNYSSGWEVVNNAYELKGYSTGGYMISINQPDSRAISTTNLNFTNSEIAVDVQKITGARDSQFGIVCRFQDKFNFYAFVISADGYAGIVRIEDGVSETLGGNQLIRVENIKQDDGTNAMKAVCRDDQLELIVNSETIVSAADSVFASGDAGIFAETFDTGESAVIFNHFVITKP
ncbi:MAG: hypothetical protein GX603_02305 [Chloroflexi bacterium]|nr:hypothetical protein [Chloroflexota bacterium]